LANTVYDSKVIKLQDDTEVTLTPLPIGLLKKFMAAWKEFANLETEEQAFDIYINCCGIALSRDFKEKFEKTLDAETVVTEQYREYLEGVLDMDTIYEVLDVCGGLKLYDPKLLEEAQKIAAEQAGTN
jgi:hypothetical protein